MSPVFDEAKYRALLEKLEISEVRYSNTCIENNISRFDAEFYQKIYFEAAKKVKANSWVTLKQLNVCLDCSAFYPSVANEYNFNSIGVPFLRVNEIIDGKIIFSDNTAFLPESLIKEYNDTIRLSYNNDILIAKGGNTAGKVGFISNKYDYYATCRDVVILRTNKISKINPQILSLYLQCDFGKLLIEKTISQTGQPHLTLPLLERLPIPLVLEKIQYGIKKCTDLSIQCSEKSNNIYVESEQLLLQELGLTDWQSDDESVATKTFADFQNSGRLDAEYYQPKYDDLFNRIALFEKFRLGDIVNITKSIEPGSEAYQEDGVPFVRVSDITKFGITPPEIHLDRDKYYSENLTPKKDTILLSKDGSVGIAYKVENDLDVITSGALLHLTVKNNDFLPDYLTLVLNSIVVKLQAERDAGGSIIQHWKPSEIENVIIPKLPKAVQNQIAEKVRESFALRKESKRLLDLAKHAVEVAIEQGEDAAMKLLERFKDA